MSMEDKEQKVIESVMAKAAKNLKPMNVTITSSPPDTIVEPTKITVSMADRYRKAFQTVYRQLDDFQRNHVDNFTKGPTVAEEEVDKTLKCVKVSLTSREKDFARRVASLAEKD